MFVALIGKFSAEAQTGIRRTDTSRTTIQRGGNVDTPNGRNIREDRNINNRTDSPVHPNDPANRNRNFPPNGTNNNGLNKNAPIPGSGTTPPPNTGGTGTGTDKR